MGLDQRAHAKDDVLESATSAFGAPRNPSRRGNVAAQDEERDVRLEVRRIRHGAHAAILSTPHGPLAGVPGRTGLPRRYTVVRSAVRIGSVVGSLGHVSASTVTAMVCVVPSSASTKVNTEPSGSGRKHVAGTGVPSSIIHTS